MCYGAPIEAEQESIMGKHITDGPRKTSDKDRMEHYTELDHKTKGHTRPQAEQIMKKTQKVDNAERTKRFLDIDRRGE